MQNSRLFIYHIKNILGEERENYVMAWFGEMDPNHPFQPAEISDNIINRRKDILKHIKNLTDGNMALGMLRDNVGITLKTSIGLNKLFTNLQKYEGKEISILTNDVQIPWEWVYFEEKKKFLCELFPYGKQFLEKIDLIQPPVKPKLIGIKNLEDQLKESIVLILYDLGGGRGLVSLPSVEEEIKKLQNIFQNAGIRKKNIKLINGAEDNSESKFLKIITGHGEAIKIIHYAGHIIKNSLYMKSGEIECKEIVDATFHKKLSAPLVFLNGCFSADILDEWEQEKNLSTAFLASGAAGCICTRRSIDDEGASNFSCKFYEKLLSKEETAPETIGSVLQISRQEIKKSCKPEDFSWLTYTLHGSPSYELFPRKYNTKAVTEQTPSIESIEKISKFTV